MNLVKNQEVKKVFRKKPLDKLGLGIPPHLGSVRRPHLGPAMFTTGSLVGFRGFNRLAAFRTALSATKYNGLPLTLKMELCPFLADNPYLCADRLDWIKFMRKKLLHALVVHVKADTTRNGFLCFPEPFFYQVTRTLNKDSLGWLWNKIGYCKSHKGLTCTHLANHKGGLVIFLVKRTSHRENPPPGL